MTLLGRTFAGSAFSECTVSRCELDGASRHTSVNNRHKPVGLCVVALALSAGCYSGIPEFDSDVSSGSSGLSVGSGETTSANTSDPTGIDSQTGGETDGTSDGETETTGPIDPSATGEPTTGEPTTGEPTTDEPTTDEPTTDEPTTGDPTTGDPTTGDPTTGDPTTGDPTTGDPTTGDPTTGDPTTGDPTTGGNDGPPVPDNSYCNPVADWPEEWWSREEEMLPLVNAHRSQGANCGSQGNFGPAPALTAHPALRCAARAHSKDMADNNFFSHTNLMGESPGDRIDKTGYNWSTWGENIAAGNATAAATVNQWMNSDGHCANIMNPSFQHIGIGYSPGGQYGHMWTQVFGAGS